MKDKYYINRIFECYYHFILSNGTLIYLYLAMHPQLKNGQVECSMSELELHLNMSHTTIRRYEIILILMDLLKIEAEYIDTHSPNYKVKKKRYILYKPLGPLEFKRRISQKHIPKNLDKLDNNILPDQSTKRYQSFLKIEEQLNKVADSFQSIYQYNNLEDSINNQIFNNSQITEDIFTIEKLFKTYYFLPSKALIFYLYLYKYWLQSSNINIGLFIPRKHIKKTLGFGDTQIRESMYVLAAIHLLDIQKEKYYRYFLKPPVSKENLPALRLRSSLNFLLPKDVFQRQSYLKLYENLEYELNNVKRGGVYYAILQGKKR